MLLRRLKSGIFYARSAVAATYDVVRENIVPTAIAAATTAATAAAGSVVIPVIIGGGAVAAIALKARSNYIDRLGQRVLKNLSAEKKQALDNYIEHFSADEKLNHEIKDECSKVLTPLFIKECAEGDITHPLLFKVSKGETVLYVLGTLHSISSNKLPKFAQSIISSVLRNPHALVIGETEPWLQSNIANRNLSQKLAIFFHELFHLSKILLPILRKMVSIPNIAKGTIRPWYFSSSISPEFAYLCMHERSKMMKKNNFLSIFMAWCSDFMSPGMGFFLTSTDEFNPTPKVVQINKNGMDLEFFIKRTALGLPYHSLETNADFLDSTALKNIAKLTPKQIWEMIELVHETVPEKQKERSELTNTDRNAKKQKAIDTTVSQGKGHISKFLHDYRTGSLSEVASSTYKKIDFNQIGLSEKELKLIAKLEEFGILANSQASLIARNLNWFPQLLKLISQFKEGFLFVGACHLLGNFGVLNLLSQAGYTIVRVTGENTYQDEAELKLLKDQTHTLPQKELLSLMTERSLLYYRNAQANRQKQRCCCEKTTQQQILNITSNGKIKLI